MVRIPRQPKRFHPSYHINVTMRPDFPQTGNPVHMVNYGAISISGIPLH